MKRLGEAAGVLVYPKTALALLVRTDPVRGYESAMTDHRYTCSDTF